MQDKGSGAWNQKPLPLGFFCCVTLDKLLTLSDLPFLPIQRGYNILFFFFLASVRTNENM